MPAGYTFLKLISNKLTTTFKTLATFDEGEWQIHKINVFIILILAKLKNISSFEPGNNAATTAKATTFTHSHIVLSNNYDTAWKHVQHFIFMG